MGRTFQFYHNWIYGRNVWAWSHKGTTRFKIQNLEGKIVAENMSRLRLRLDFPEIEKKIILEGIAKS